MSIFTKVWSWLGKVVSSAKTKYAPIAVTITEELKTLWASGVPNFLATVIDKAIGHGTIAETIVNKIGIYLPAALATELGIEDLPANATPEQIAKFEQDVIAAWTPLTDKDKLYTTLAAQIGGIIQRDTQPGVVLSFGQLAKDAEEAYQDYLADVAAEGNNANVETTQLEQA
jgi:hypothetical protein